MIQCRFHKTFGDKRMEMDFESEARLLGVYGPSGAGKSSLLSFMAGLLTADEAYLRLGDDVLVDSSVGLCVPAHERRIAMVFQDHQLFPHLSVQENLRFGYDILPDDLCRFELERIVQLLELESFLDRKPTTLSGGESQRVALGRALLCSPRLLLLDEPLSSLDGDRKRRILGYLRDIKQELGLPMLYVSHSLPEILELTDRLLVLADGRRLAEGPFFEVLHQEEVVEMAHSLGLQNVLRVTILSHDLEAGSTLGQAGLAELNLPRLSDPIGSVVPIVLRPEDIVLSRSRLEGTSLQNQIPARVIETWPAGSGVLVRADFGQQLLIEVSRAAAQSLALEPGTEIHLLFKARALKSLQH
jgi:molybdate transport system ATP-binding protein